MSAKLTVDDKNSYRVLSFEKEPHTENLVITVSNRLNYPENTTSYETLVKYVIDAEDARVLGYMI